MSTPQGLEAVQMAHTAHWPAQLLLRSELQSQMLHDFLIVSSNIEAKNKRTKNISGRNKSSNWFFAMFRVCWCGLFYLRYSTEIRGRNVCKCIHAEAFIHIFMRECP